MINQLMEILYSSVAILEKYNWSKLTFYISYKNIFIIRSRYYFQYLIVILFVLAQQPFHLFHIVLLSSKINIK